MSSVPAQSGERAEYALGRKALQPKLPNSDCSVVQSNVVPSSLTAQTIRSQQLLSLSGVHPVSSKSDLSYCPPLLLIVVHPSDGDINLAAPVVLFDRSRKDLATLSDDFLFPLQVLVVCCLLLSPTILLMRSLRAGWAYETWKNWLAV
ncbi:hypothetical protein ANN_01105 [Periplaneta americana]|uniref:Uncharacterized protein n=1 Tax=Periplaneta americana TaxID=6978 RepID=A0ABQ8TV36_PERAM|nr:hypothetical protein ANN_01105 [Periplaneta americana]